MRTSIEELAAWADWATMSQLSSLARSCAARLHERRARRGFSYWANRVTLPLLPGSTRFWGADLLLPLGFRVDPELPASAIRHVVGASQDDLVVMDENGHELIGARGVQAAHSNRHSARTR